MASAHPPASDDTVRAMMRQWLDHWNRVGPLLQAERWTRLRAMTDEEARRVSQMLLELWQPEWHGDGGEELLLHQRVFARARRHESGR